MCMRGRITPALDRMRHWRGEHSSAVQAGDGNYLLAGVQQGPGQARGLAGRQGCFEVQMRLEQLIVGLLLQRSWQLLICLRRISQTERS